MKKLLLASTITALLLTSVVSSPKVQAASIAQSVCEYVAADNKTRMRSFLKSNKLKIRNIYKGIQCNGQNLLQFAATRGSIKTGTLMIHRLPKSIISKNLALIKEESPLFDAASARVSS